MPIKTFLCPSRQLACGRDTQKRGKNSGLGFRVQQIKKTFNNARVCPFQWCDRCTPKNGKMSV
jgi:hypothetical protein